MNRSILLAAAAALAASPALAATVVQTDTILPDASPNGSLLSFQQFDSHLGTLTGVTLTLDADMTAAGTISNPSNSGTRTYNLTEGAIAGLTGSGFSLAANIGPAVQQVSVGKKSSVSLGLSGSSSDSMTLSSNLSGFAGAGALDFALTRTSLFASDGNSKLNITPDIGGSATLTYDYTARSLNTPAIPEPGTWAMLLVGSAGLGGALRRRTAAATA